MGLDLDDDLREEDRDDPRAEVGYQPLDRKPPPAATLPPASTVGTCIGCKRDGVILQTRQRATGDVSRDRCAKCEGDENREIVELTRDYIRQMKAAVTQGQSHIEADLRPRLARLIGGDKVHELVFAIRAKLETGGGPAPKGGRR